jgi:hypothetical protein
MYYFVVFVFGAIAGYFVCCLMDDAKHRDYCLHCAELVMKQYKEKVAKLGFPDRRKNY